MQVQAKEFLNALAVAGQVVDKRYNLDFRSCVSLVAHAQQLTIISNDRSTVVEITVHAADGPSEPQGIAVAFSALNAILAGPAKRGLPVSLGISGDLESHPVLIVDRTKVLGRKPAWLGVPPRGATVLLGVVDSSVLRSGLQRVLPALDPKHQDVKFHRIVLENGELIATDGHRLHRAPVLVTGGSGKSVFFSDGFARLLIRSLPKEAPVCVQTRIEHVPDDEPHQKTWLQLHAQNICLANRVDDFSYLEWRGAADDAACGVKMIVSRNDLLEAIEGSRPDASATVLLTTHGLSVDVILSDELTRRETPVSIYLWERPLPVGRGARFHVKYFFEAVAAIATPLVELTFSGPSSPAQVASVQGDGSGHLVMPMSEYKPTLIGDLGDPGAAAFMQSVDLASQIKWCQDELHSTMDSLDAGDRQWLTRRLSDLESMADVPVKENEDV